MDAGRIETANVRLVVADGSVLEPLLGPASLDSINAEADVSGPWAAPKIAASGTVTGLGVPDAAVNCADWTVRVEPAQGAGGQVRLHATAAFAGVRAGGKDIAALLGGDPRLGIDAILDRNSNELKVETVRLDAPALTLTGEGSVGLANGDGEATFHGRVEDLAALRTATGRGLVGSGDLTAEVARRSGNVQGTFSIAADALRTGLAPVDACSGQNRR